MFKKSIFLRLVYGKRSFVYGVRSVASIAESFNDTISDLDAVAKAHSERVSSLAEEAVRIQDETSASLDEINKARGFAANLRRLVGPTSDAVQAS
ncbi:hypothetical protein [Parvibaculum sp.]|uniref:hypothetical protein n=1 Tax=Parvibaculum sp. TaxID=2024848 RepID=UPI0027349C82|nr:hypothetical protein [Parvibaculum sp.]MDP3327177.1 hypothetical protein [Parvibaculum sp.]